MISRIDLTGGRLSDCGAHENIWRTPLALSAVVLTAAMLGACAQSSAVSDRSASSAVRQAPPQVAEAAPSPSRSARIRRTAKSEVNKTQVAKAPSNKTQARTPGAADGLASFYSQGEKTASGEKFNAGELTAAHRTLPFGTKVRVTNVTNGQSVTVRINDRGPFVNGRVIDVSHSAAQSLGMVGRGVAKVKLDVVD